jgi:cytochrome c peroxidase
MRKKVAVAVVLSLLVGCEDKSKQVAPAPSGSAAPVASASATLAQLPTVPSSPAVPATPEGLPPPVEAADNPASADKVSLGWALFFDKRISKDGSMACDSCHHPDGGWATTNAVDAKVGGAKNKRNAPSVQNLAYHKLYYWDGRMPSLEAVCNAAWKGQLGAEPADVAKKLNDIPAYKARFVRAFNAEASADNVPKALGAFLFALKSGNSAFDKFQKGDKSAMSAEAQHGYKLFASSGCTNCHQPPLFTDSAFHNVGVGMDKAEADRDKGRTDATKDAADEGKFKTPSLRDVAKTAPYFHDGSAATLEDAIKYVASGGTKNPKLDPVLKPQTLSDKDRADLKAFLEALSGTATFTGPPADMPR